MQEVFDHGRVQSWGNTNTLNASTALLDGMHYRGLLRVVRRDTGTRVYEAIAHAPADDAPAARHERARQLLLRIVDKYAPLPSASLGYLAQLLQYGAPHLQGRDAHAAGRTARQPAAGAHRRRHLAVDPGEDPAAGKWRVDPERARLLAPFDPVVWDRRRFELLWGWAYKFEAYTPAAKRTMGHYALPLLLRRPGRGLGQRDAGRQGAAGGARRLRRQGAEPRPGAGGRHRRRTGPHGRVPPARP